MIPALVIPKGVRVGPKSAGGYVYFIRGANLVKIGRSISWSDRFVSLQTMSPVPLEPLLVVAAAKVVESEIHRMFSAYRRHGEWFDLPGGWRAQVDAYVAANRLHIVHDSTPIGESVSLEEGDKSA